MIPKIIGVSGNATSGKNTLARILASKLPKSCVYSLANNLRCETEGFLSKFGHNVWSEKSEEKSKFRNYLVEYAEIIRQSTKGQYFWKLLKREVEWNNLAVPFDFAIISDVRFDEFENDEVWWVKQNGILVYIEAYKNGSKIGPANYKEAENEGKLAAKCDKLLIWDHEAKDDEQIYLTNKTQVDKLIEAALKICSKNCQSHKS